MPKPQTIVNRLQAVRRRRMVRRSDMTQPIRISFEKATALVDEFLDISPHFDKNSRREARRQFLGSGQGTCFGMPVIWSQNRHDSATGTMKMSEVVGN